MIVCDTGPLVAAVVAAAERLGATEVATLDRRHFTVIRPVMSPHSHFCPEG